MLRRFIAAAVPSALLIGLTLGLETASDKGPTVAGVTNNRGVAELASEVSNKGWIMYSAQTQGDDWDLFLMRPDGSGRRNITNTTSFNEAAARFSPDGRRILYYRQPLRSKVDNNSYGTTISLLPTQTETIRLCMAVTIHGLHGGPGGDKIVCLTKNNIQIVDLSTRKVILEVDRKGIFELR